MAERPNIVLIVLDTVRADALEPYGAAAGSSPTLAGLAREGEVSPATFANACWTLPSHAAMFTGLLPRQAGLINAPGGRPSGCRPMLEAQRERLLPQVLRSAGYSTYGVSTNLWLTERSGFDIGFDRFDVVDTQRQNELTADGIGDRLRWFADGVSAKVDDGAAEARERISDALVKAHRPFFAFANLVEAHSPYLPPRPYSPLGPIDRGRAALDASRYLSLDAVWRACAAGEPPPEPVLERMRSLYAGAVRLLDDWIAELLETLDRAGTLDETLIVVTSDHGENFGEGGLMGHAFSLDDRLIRLPFISMGPATLRSPVSLAGLPAALADAIGLAEHPWTERAPDETIAVAQFNPAAAAGDPRVAEALEAWGLGIDAAPRITTRLTVATDGRHKLLRRGDQELVFDLTEDPLERHSRSPESVADAPLRRLRAAIADSDGDGDGVPSAAASEGDSGISDDEREDLERRMRLLGYL